MSIPSAKKILIVEDEKDILQLVKLYLEKEGYRTVTASTGSEGLAQVRTGKPDLIVLDLMLPDMNGHDLVRLLRREEGGAEGYAKRLRHGTIGRGLNDYDAICTELRSVGFDGWISIEDGVEGMDQLERSVAFLRRKMAEYWGP